MANHPHFNILKAFAFLSKFETGLGAQLPEAYKKFWREWKICKPPSVVYVEPSDDGVRAALMYNELKAHSAPFRYAPFKPYESILGETTYDSPKRDGKRRGRFSWLPMMRRSVVHSEVLKEYLSTLATDYTLDRIHDCLGFDHYLLKNPACDLRSSFSLKLKRRILQELSQGCPNHSDNPAQQERIYNKYKCYLDAYTPEEIDWYGYSFAEAIRKLKEARQKQTLDILQLFHALSANRDDSLKKRVFMQQLQQTFEKLQIVCLPPKCE